MRVIKKQEISVETLKKVYKKSLKKLKPVSFFINKYYKFTSLYIRNHQVAFNKTLNVVTIVLAIFSLFIGYRYLTRPNYLITASAQKLIGKPDVILANKGLVYSAKDKSYQLNPSEIGVKASSIPSDSVGIAGGSKVYSFVAPNNLNKNYMSFYDNDLHISFALKPTFKTAPVKYSNGEFIYPINKNEQSIYSIKTNGLKEDIILNHKQGNSASFSYKLDLPSTLQAKRMPDGSIGVYSADPVLLGSINAASSSDQAIAAKAKVNSSKDHLEFILMAPTITASGGVNNAKAQFALNGNNVTISATGLNKLNYPISIDPSVVVNIANNLFGTGNPDSNVFDNYYTIATGLITGGTSGSWATTGSSWLAGGSGIATAQYNYYMYELGGYTGSADVTTVQYSAINNSTGALGTWTATSSLATAVSFAQAQVYNGYIYVIGGWNGNTSTPTFYNSVQYAPICTGTNTATGCTIGATAGTIGTFSTLSTNFTTARFDFGSVVYNNTLYIAGGGTSLGGTSTDQSDIQYATFLGNGKLSSWATSAQSIQMFGTTPLRGIGMQAYNGYLYIFGGWHANADIGGVVDYKINADGSLGTEAAAGNNMPISLDNFGSAVIGGYLYIWGGSSASTNSPITSTTLNANGYYSQLNSNGTNGPWIQTSTFLAVMDSGSYAFNGYLYNIGGYSGSTTGVCSTTSSSYCNKQYNAPINPAGFAASTSFSATANGLPSALYWPGVTIYNGWIYVVGGCLNDVYAKGSCNGGGNVSSSIYYAPINSSGVITAAFTSTAILPNSIYGMAVTATENTLYTLGGCTGPGTTYETCNNAQASVVSYSLNPNTGAPTLIGSNSGPYSTYGNGVAVYNGTIYEFGGCLAQSSSPDYMCGTASVTETENQVYYASIPIGGGAITIGNWTQSSNSMPAAVFGFEYATYNGYLYFTGGCQGSTSTSSPCNYFSTSNAVYYSKLAGYGSTNGVFSTASNSQPIGSFGGSLSAYNGYLYITPGCTAINAYSSGNGVGCSSINNNVYEAAIKPTGDIGAFIKLYVGTSATPLTLTTAVWGAATFIFNGYLESFGGCSGNSSSSDYMCGSEVSAGQAIQLNLGGNGEIPGWSSGGTASSWSTGASLNASRWGTATAVYNGLLYVLGGEKASSSTTCTNGSASTYCNDVQVYSLNTGGGQTLLNTYYFTTVRAYAAATAYNGYLYLTGGLNGITNYNDLQFAQISGNTLITPGCTSSCSTTTPFTTLTNPTNWPVGGDIEYLIAYAGYLYLLDSGASSVSVNINTTNGQIGSTATVIAVPSILGGASITNYGSYVYVSNGQFLSTPFYTAKFQLTSGGGTGSSSNVNSIDIIPNSGVNYSESSTFAYNGYYYIVGGYSSIANCNTATSSSDFCNIIWAAPIQSDGSLGNFQMVGILNDPTFETSSFAYGGYMYYLGNATSSSSYANNIYYDTIQTVPHTAQYSLVVNTYEDTTPTSLVVDGVGNYDNGSNVGQAGNQINYSFATSGVSPDACTTTAFSSQNHLNYIDPTSQGLFESSSPTPVSTDGCGNAATQAQYEYIEVYLDDSQYFSYPDYNNLGFTTTHSYIASLFAYFHPNEGTQLSSIPHSGDRLRGGQTFINDRGSSLDSTP